MQSSGSMLIPIVLLALVLTLLTLGVPLATYKGRWTQWSLRARIGLLLILAISTGVTISFLMMTDFVVYFITNDIAVIFAILIIIYGVCSSSSFRQFLKEKRSGSG